MLKAQEALKTVEQIVTNVFSGLLRVKRLNDEQLIVEINRCPPREWRRERDSEPGRGFRGS